MAAESSIEWTDATWNPVRGCVKISPGCKHCYAETFAERWRGVKGNAYEQGFDPRMVPEKLSDPLRWQKGRRIFVNSMSDLFQEAVSYDYIAAVFGVMASARQHTYQVLTKRADRLPQWFAWLAGEAPAALAEWVTMVEDAERVCGERVPGPRSKDARSCPGEALVIQGAMKRHVGDGRAADRAKGSFWPRWPLPNVHLGVSVEDRKFGVPRIAHLQQTPAAVRFLSIEPLLEDVGTLDLTGIHQVIVGAESGHGARPMREDWVRSIRDQATAAGVAFFYKQATHPTAKGRVVSLPMLDGRQWSEVPS